jgi:hypothetical protein
MFWRKALFATLLILLLSAVVSTGSRTLVNAVTADGGAWLQEQDINMGEFVWLISTTERIIEGVGSFLIILWAADTTHLNRRPSSEAQHR